MIDELYYALVALTEAKSDRDKAYSEYEGYSWGYHGQRYETLVEEAKQRFSEAFRAAVLEVIESKR